MVDFEIIYIIEKINGDYAYCYYIIYNDIFYINIIKDNKVL